MHTPIMSAVHSKYLGMPLIRQVADKKLDLHLPLQVLLGWEHHDVQALAKAKTCFARMNGTTLLHACVLMLQLLCRVL